MYHILPEYVSIINGKLFVAIFIIIIIIIIIITSFLELVSPKAKIGKTLFVVKHTNPSDRMSCKGQNNFRITVILYAHQAWKTLFRPVKSNKSISLNVLQRLEQFWKACHYYRHLL